MIECVMSSLDVASVNWWPGVDKVGKLTFCGLDLLYMDQGWTGKHFFSRGGERQGQKF